MSVWAAPITFSSAATLTAAQLNGSRDNLNFLKGALDLLTGSTTADVGTGMSLSLVLASPSSPGLAVRATGDTNPQFAIRASGELVWSLASAVGTRVMLDPDSTAQRLVWQGFDAAGTQSTVTSIVELPAVAAAASVSGVRLSGDAHMRVAMGTNASGYGRLGFTIGSSATSTNLWRRGTGILGTTDTFEAQIFDSTSMGDGIMRSSPELGYYVSGTQVVGSRKTGWGTMTGTGARTGIDLETATNAQLGNRLKSLIDDLRTHGIIGA